MWYDGTVGLARAAECAALFEGEHMVGALKETPPEDYAELLTCRGCSGYGNGGYRMYVIQNGRPKAYCKNSHEEYLKAQEKKKAEAGE